MTSSSFEGSSPGGSPHPYIPATEADRVRMLERVGVADLDALFADLPADLRDPAIDLPPALTEPELIALLTERAAANAAFRHDRTSSARERIGARFRPSHLTWPAAPSSSPRTRRISPRSVRARYSRGLSFSRWFAS